MLIFRSVFFPLRYGAYSAQNKSQAYPLLYEVDAQVEISSPGEEKFTN